MCLANNRGRKVQSVLTPQKGSWVFYVWRGIEAVLRFVAQLPIRKVPVVNTEEDTRLMALEEHATKVVAIMISNRTEQYVADWEWAYEAGRAVGEVASLVTMTDEQPGSWSMGAR